MNLRLGLLPKIFLLVLIPLGFELIFAATLAVLEQQSELDAASALHSKIISDCTNSIVRNFFQLGSATKGEALTAFFGNGYQTSVQEIRKKLDKLKDTVKNNPGQAAIVHKSDVAAQEAYSIVEKLRSAYNSSGPLGALDVFQLERPRLRACTKQVVSPELISMAEKEKEIEDKSPGIQADFRQKIKMCLAIGTLFNVLLSLIIAGILGHQIVRRLKVTIDNNDRLTRGIDLHSPDEEYDEIGSLDRSFHKMAKALDEAKRREHAQIENAVDVICSLTKHGNFITVNPASKTVFGYDPEELTSLPLRRFLLEDDITHFYHQLDQAIASGEVPPFEARMKHKDGRIIDVLWAVHWSPDERILFCVAHNITDRKNAERARQEVVQMVSHDLRSPLSTINAFLEMVAEGLFGNLSERGLHLLKKAELNCNRMLTLINDLLDVERIKAGGFQILPEPIEVAEILELTAQSVSAWAEDQGVRIAVSPTTIGASADKKRIIQVLVNLVSNAVKFSPKGSTVTLDAQADPRTDKFVQIRVIDQGRGVPEDMRTSIFERFQQVKTSDATEKGGSGLGLAICKAIVELHGGNIKVESNDGQGSIFSFTIPMIAATTQ